MRREILKQAASLLGISQAYVYRLLDNLELKHLLA
jgi:excisionase family DNA binding protein